MMRTCVRDMVSMATAPPWNSFLSTTNSGLWWICWPSLNHLNVGGGSPFTLICQMAGRCAFTVFE